MSSPWLHLQLAAGDLGPDVVALHVPEARALGLEAADPADAEAEPLVENASVTDSGRRSRSRSRARRERRRARWRRSTLTRSPLPPVPWPKQSAPGSVLIVDGARVLADLGQRLAAGVDDPKVERPRGRAERRQQRAAAGSSDRGGDRRRAGIAGMTI